MGNKTITVILVIIGLILGLIVGGAFLNRGVDQSDIDAQIAEITKKAELELANKDAIISNQSNKITELETKEVVSYNSSNSDNSVTQTEGYLIDELSLGGTFSKTLSDREVKKLLDGEVEFDEKDYDFEEVVVLNNLKVSINDEDFKENAYLSVLENGIEYKVIFENALDTSKIDEEDTLKFTFLGKDIEISEWDNDKITISYGSEVMVSEGESVTVDGKNVNVMGIYNDAVYISVDGEGKSLDEGDKATINGIEVKVKEVLYSAKDSQVSKVVLVVGDKVSEEIMSGDEYEEDSVWEYVITPNSIGLVLVENFEELDDEFKVLGDGESICLPNNYVCVKYNGLSSEDTEKYSFDLDDGLVRINGKFQSGLNDYDRVYYNATSKKFYEDNDEEDEILETLKLGDSDLTLTSNVDGHMVIDNITVGKLLKNILVDSNSIASKEDNYRTAYGIIIENPENSVEEQEITLVVPMDKLEASVSVI